MRRSEKLTAAFRGTAPEPVSGKQNEVSKKNLFTPLFVPLTCKNGKKPRKNAAILSFFIGKIFLLYGTIARILYHLALKARAPATIRSEVTGLKVAGCFFSIFEFFVSNGNSNKNS